MHCLAPPLNVSWPGSLLCCRPAARRTRLYTLIGAAQAAPPTYILHRNLRAHCMLRPGPLAQPCMLPSRAQCVAYDGAGRQDVGLKLLLSDLSTSRAEIVAGSRCVAVGGCLLRTTCTVQSLAQIVMLCCKTVKAVQGLACNAWLKRQHVSCWLRMCLALLSAACIVLQVSMSPGPAADRGGCTIPNSPFLRAIAAGQLAHTCIRLSDERWSGVGALCGEVCRRSVRVAALHSTAQGQARHKAVAAAAAAAAGVLPFQGVIAQGSAAQHHHHHHITTVFTASSRCCSSNCERRQCSGKRAAGWRVVERGSRMPRICQPQGPRVQPAAALAARWLMRAWLGSV